MGTGRVYTWRPFFSGDPLSSSLYLCFETLGDELPFANLGGGYNYCTMERNSSLWLPGAYDLPKPFREYGSYGLGAAYGVPLPSHPSLNMVFGVITIGHYT